MKALVLVIAVGSLSGCVVRMRGPSGPADYPPPPPGRRADTIGQQSVLQTKEIKARRVFANTIYCKEIHAGGGGVGQVNRWEGEQDWGRGEIRQDEVRADTIYAKEIHADYIEAGVVNCKEVKIGGRKHGKN